MLRKTSATMSREIENESMGVAKKTSATMSREIENGSVGVAKNVCNYE